MCKNILKYVSLYAPVFSSFLYVTLLIAPIIVQSIVMDNQTNPLPIMLLCAAIQTVLSVYGSIMMGYEAGCCFRYALPHEIDEELDRIWCESPLSFGTLFSPGYIIYLDLPWFFYNIWSLRNVRAILYVEYLRMITPLIVYFPFFAVGCALKFVHDNHDGGDAVEKKDENA